MILDLIAMASQDTDPIPVSSLFNFSKYLGNNTARDITVGVDLANHGGMVWIKRAFATQNHVVTDTARGPSLTWNPNTSAAQYSAPSGGVTAFNTDGFALGPSGPTPEFNGDGAEYSVRTIRKAPKLLDIVTYTGSGTAQTLAHSLGVRPGFIIVKPLNSVLPAAVQHVAAGATKYANLNSTAVFAVSSAYWNNTEPTSTSFTVGTSLSISSSPYVAYLFADDESSEGMIRCGSYVGDGTASKQVTVGWRPQFLMVKGITTSGAYFETTEAGPTATFQWNAADAQSSGPQTLNASGFTTGPSFGGNTSGQTYGYLSIRAPS